MADAPKIQPATPDVIEAPEPSFAQKIIAEDDAKAAQAKLQRHSVLQDDGPHSARSTSDYRSQEHKSNTAEAGQAFGRKINVNPEVARQTENLRPQLQMPQGQSLRESTQIAQQRPLPPSPQPEDLTRLMGSRAFQGHLRGGPLSQKLEQQIIFATPHATGTNPKNMGEVLERAEVMQLFSLRNRPDMTKEERESLRRLIRYEAAVANRARERVVSIEYHTESNPRKENPDALMRSARTETHDTVRRELMEKLARSAESFFERVLQKALGSNQSAVATLPDGAEAELPVKSAEEWESFFQNTTALSSELQEASAEQSTLSQVLYRGMFASQGQLKLVSDLSLAENGEINEYKFAQILLSDPKMADLLKSIKPGQSLPTELIRALGEQVAFLKLVHMQAGARELSDVEKQLLLKEFQREVSSGYQSALEKELRERRLKKPADPFLWAGDQFDKKEERKGQRTVLMYLIYFVLLCTAGLVVYFIANQFL